MWPPDCTSWVSLAVTSSPALAFLASIDLLSSACKVVPFCRAAPAPLAAALVEESAPALADDFPSFFLSFLCETSAWPLVWTVADPPETWPLWLAPALALVWPAETEVLVEADPLAPVCAAALAVSAPAMITAIQ